MQCKKDSESQKTLLPLYTFRFRGIINIYKNRCLVISCQTNIDIFSAEDILQTYANNKAWKIIQIKYANTISIDNLCIRLRQLYGLNKRFLILIEAWYFLSLFLQITSFYLSDFGGRNGKYFSSFHLQNEYNKFFFKDVSIFVMFVIFATKKEIAIFC